MNAHEIDYEIFGEEMQYVSIELDPGEAVVAEAGGFMMSEPDIKMETIFGDGSHKEKQGGILDKVLSAGKRILTGESLFMTVFYNTGQAKRTVSFASPYPGKIMPIDLSEKGGRFICQKDAFLCAAKGVSVGIEFSKRLGRGFFGGEGFIMQKLEGDGMAFVHAGGTMARKELAPGEVLRQAFSSPPSKGPESSMCNPCLLAAWQNVSGPQLLRGVEGTKGRGVSSAAWAISSWVIIADKRKSAAALAGLPDLGYLQLLRPGEVL